MIRVNPRSATFSTNQNNAQRNAEIPDRQNHWRQPMMASKVLLWTVLYVRSCSGQLKHMRAHGHDGKHEHTKPVESSFVDFDSFPPGEVLLLAS
jgi:hypothetical protein